MICHITTFYFHMRFSPLLLKYYIFFCLRVYIQLILNVQLINQPATRHTHLDKIINTIYTIHFLQCYNYSKLKWFFSSLQAFFRIYLKPPKTRIICFPWYSSFFRLLLSVPLLQDTAPSASDGVREACLAYPS